MKVKPERKRIVLLQVGSVAEMWVASRAQLEHRLFNRHTFCEVARLVNIRALVIGNVVGELLQWHH